MLERLPCFFTLIIAALMSTQVSANSSAVLVTPLVSTSATAPAAAIAVQQSFADWRADLRMQALSEGVSPLLFEQAFAGLSPDPQVLAADQSQPEFSRPVWE